MDFESLMKFRGFFGILAPSCVGMACVWVSFDIFS